jgi:hypothetical protein
MKMEQTQCSETSVIKHHTPGNNPTDSTQHLEHGESLKSVIIITIIIIIILSSKNSLYLPGTSISPETSRQQLPTTA